MAMHNTNLTYWCKGQRGLLTEQKQPAHCGWHSVGWIPHSACILLVP